MILTNYYKFERLEGTVSKLRIVCTASTMDYTPFENLRATRARKGSAKFDAVKVGDLFVYFGNLPTTFCREARCKADKCMTKTKNISSIFMLSPEFGFGDMKGTPDALLFRFQGAEVTNGRLQDGAMIEVFVAKGQAKDRQSLCQQMATGSLYNEMTALRAKAKCEQFRELVIWQKQQFIKEQGQTSDGL